MSMNDWELDHEARWESHFDDASHDDPPPASPEDEVVEYCWKGGPRSIQCSGITRAGHRCRTYFMDSREEPQYCKVHGGGERDYGYVCHRLKGHDGECGGYQDLSDFVPKPVTMTFTYEFAFEDCNGPFYSRTAKDGRPRWWVILKGKRIGRITVYGPNDFVAYPDHEDSLEEFSGPASYCSTLVDACMALAGDLDSQDAVVAQ